MRGDALASGASSATFTANDQKRMSTDEFQEKIGHTNGERPVFCLCNAKGCEEFIAYSAKEFLDHFHLVHA
jgi:hypothetical protein